MAPFYIVEQLASVSKTFDSDAPMGPPQTLSLVIEPLLRQALHASANDVFMTGNSSEMSDMLAPSQSNKPSQGSDVNHQSINIDDYLPDFDLNDLDFQKLLE